ncbi:hypothetical protein HQ590_10355 [bacterium]|nr:hypothetical protein [bacterium]
MNFSRCGHCGQAGAILVLMIGWPGNGLALTVPWQNAASFNYTNQLIRYEPNRTGLFRATETNRITVADGSSVRIYRVGTAALSLVYSGAPPVRVWPPGYYFVESATDRNAFAALPAGYRGVPQLGADAERLATDSQSNFSRNRDAIGIGWCRDGTWWENITTKQMRWGQYDFRGDVSEGNSSLDLAMTEADRDHRNLVVQLSGWPRYLTNAADRTVERYAHYVNDVTRHIAASPHGGTVRAVTLWNEPFYMSGLSSAVPDIRQTNRFANVTWKGDWMDWLAAMYPVASAIIRSNLPQAHVLGGNCMDFGVGWQLAERLQRAGVLTSNIVTAIGHHNYDSSGRYDEATQYHGGTMDENLTKLRSQYPPQTPLFMDEEAVGWSPETEKADKDALGIPYHGWGDLQDREHRGLEWYDMFCGAIKKAAIYGKHQVIAIGHMFCRAHNWRTWNGTYDGWFAGDGVDLRGPRPATVGWVAANHWLVEATFVQDRTLTNGVHLYEFAKPDGSHVLFAWCKRGQQSRLTAPAWLQRTDVFGQPTKGTVITHEPVLFHSRTADRTKDLISAFKPGAY